MLLGFVTGGAGTCVVVGRENFGSGALCDEKANEAPDTAGVGVEVVVIVVDAEKEIDLVLSPSMWQRISLHTKQF